jgi:hypothetical protein
LGKGTEERSRAGGSGGAMNMQKIEPPTECNCIELLENGGVAFPSLYRSFKRFYFAHVGLDESQAYYWCSVCGRLWDKLDSPLIGEGDCSFADMQWETVVKKIGEELPADFPTDEAHFERWVRKGGVYMPEMFSYPRFAFNPFYATFRKKLGISLFNRLHPC